MPAQVWLPPVVSWHLQKSIAVLLAPFSRVMGPWNISRTFGLVLLTLCAHLSAITTSESAENVKFKGEINTPFFLNSNSTTVVLTGGGFGVYHLGLSDYIRKRLTLSICISAKAGSTVGSRAGHWNINFKETLKQHWGENKTMSDSSELHSRRKLKYGLKGCHDCDPGGGGLIISRGTLTDGACFLTAFWGGWKWVTGSMSRMWPSRAELLGHYRKDLRTPLVLSEGPGHASK